MKRTFPEPRRRLATLPTCAGDHRPHLVPHWQTAALVIIDMQRDFLSESSHGVPGTTEVVPALRRLTDGFRVATRPIVHVVRLYQPGGGDADRCAAPCLPAVRGSWRPERW
jgi:nicotinamidase-related amidase